VSSCVLFDFCSKEQLFLIFLIINQLDALISQIYPAYKLSANVYDIYHCCVYSEKLPMMDRGIIRNVYSFLPKRI